MYSLLLRPGRISLRNLLDPRAPGGLARLSLGLAVGAGVAVLVFWLTMRGLRFVSGVEVIGFLLAQRLLQFTLLSLLGFVLLSSLATTLSNFFLSDDLSLLRASPVQEGPFYAARLSQTSLLAGWMALAFVLPVLAGWGYAMGGGAAFGVMLVLVLPPLVLLPTALGAMVITLLVCLFPARRIRELFVILGVLSAAVLLLLFRMIRPERLIRPEVFGSVADYVAAFEAPQHMLLPSTWAANVLQSSVGGPVDWLALGVLYSAVWGVGSLGFLVHRRLYRLAYSRAQEGGAGYMHTGGVLDRAVERVTSGLPSIRRGFAVKDAKTFLRDPGQWSQLLLMLILVFAYVYNYAVFPGVGVKLAGIDVNYLLAVLNLLLGGFVMSALVARFAFPAVSVEGRAFWLVRTAPIDMLTLVRVKFRQSAAPLLPLGMVLVGLAAWWLALKWQLVALSVVHTALSTLGLTAMGVGMGAVYPRFRFENPAQVPMSFGGVLFMFWGLLYTLVGAAAVTWLAVPLVSEAHARSLWAELLAWGAWLTFHWLHATIPLRYGSRILTSKEYH